jgi:hypothetical protein
MTLPIFNYEARAEDIRHLLEQGGWVWFYRTPLPKCRLYLSDLVEDFYYGELSHAMEVDSWGALEETLSLESIKALGSDIQTLWDEFLDKECLTVALSERR